VFVSDNCKDILPNYLMALQGVIDSPDIPLNVSRSHLQMDRTVRQLSSHISKKVTDSLTTLMRTDKERYIRSWNDISTVLKLGILEEDKFYDKAKDLLIWKVAGGEYSTVEEYLERNREKTHDKILYTRDETSLKHFLEMYQSKGIEVLVTSNPLDTYLMEHLEQKLSPAAFQRIDAAVDEVFVDSSREKSLLDAEGKTESGRIASYFKTVLGDLTETVEAKSLKQDHVPAFFTLEERERRFRDYAMAFRMGEEGKENLQLNKKTLVVNTNNPLINAVYRLSEKNPDLSKDLVHEIYDLALLAQHEMTPDSLTPFVEKSQTLLAKLTTTLIDEEFR